MFEVRTIPRHVVPIPTDAGRAAHTNHQRPARASGRIRGDRPEEPSRAETADLRTGRGCQRLPDIVRDAARFYVEHIDTLAAKVSDLTKQLEARDHSKVVRQSAKIEDNARRWAADGLGDRCFCSGYELLRARAGLRGLNQSRANATIDGRQGSARQGLEEGSERYSKSADHRGDVGDHGATRFGVRKGSWLAKMLELKPKMLVAITLANRMARGIWAMLTKQENYRDPEVMA